MNGIIYLNYSGIIYTVLLLFCFFGKKRINNEEQKIYGYLIFAALLELATGVITSFLIYYDYNELLNQTITKIYLLSMNIWMFFFACYNYAITHTDKKGILKYIMIILVIVSSLAIVTFPLELHNINGNLSASGIGLYVEYIASSIFILICLYLCFRNRKKINKKFIPLLIFLVLGTICFLIQIIFPELFLIVPLEVFVTSVMYHTIENPDVKMIEQLNIAREDADKANQAKSDFLSSMSHEIRTPLNAIVGFSQALEEEDLPESARDEVSDIISASESLLEIVNGILDISKIEANKLDIINDEYNFRKLFHDLVMLTKARMGEDSKLDFQFSMDESIPGVLYGDHARVKQVILNLLTNAVKYTKEGYLKFRVDSVIKDDICRLIISVEDSGIGIKQENINKLFSKFERLGVEKEITIEGTGLGLAITKKLVDLMNGKIVVQSVYGRGSKFTIALDQKIVLGKEDVKEETPQELRIIDCSSKKILIVDDNNVNLKVAMRLLRDYKINIETSDSGFDCLNKIKQGNTYDLILMDDMMPKMSGTETFHKLKEDSSFNTPVVILTANAITGMKEKYLSEGFNDYLAKPIDKLALNEVIIKFLEQK